MTFTLNVVDCLTTTVTRTGTAPADKDYRFTDSFDETYKFDEIFTFPDAGGACTIHSYKILCTDSEGNMNMH